MKKIKFNPELLKEETRKFKLLSEYDFYQEEKEVPEYKNDLLLGDLSEDENDNEETGDQVDDTEVGNIASELGVEPPTEEPMGEPSEELMNEPSEEPVSDEIEVDVTSLVQGSEEAKESADRASQNSEMLLKKLEECPGKSLKEIYIEEKNNLHWASCSSMMSRIRLIKRGVYTTKFMKYCQNKLNI